MKVLKFSMNGCAPCKGLTMTLNGIKEQLALPVEEVDIDENTELAAKMNIRSVPTLIVVDEQGQEVRKHVGMANAEQLLQFINQ